MTPFTEWQTFYEIMGSAAGALTGLQFVTMALVADLPMGPAESQIGAEFSTPTVVYFGTVLLVAALLAMPWRGVTAPAIIWGIAGAAGTAYTLVAGWRMRVQHVYKPVLEDWIFRLAVPLTGYVAVATSACIAPFARRPALFVLAAAALVLLFNGIHNAWDNVTYIVFTRKADLQSGNQH